MQSEKFRDLLESLKDTKTKVRIYLISGAYYRDGYITEVNEDCLCLEKHLNSEKLDYIIPIGSISSVNIGHK